ncbi:sigma-70 family RNA polymerase sigma factor [Embleya sp. NPDC020886]|uniref:sigma-70 family RNA polymerase sigma factor n=1 Tax=Embleya sp. NPDC020886 TaxID=3363980 RepID=UPI0037A4E750
MGPGAPPGIHPGLPGRARGPPGTTVGGAEPGRLFGRSAVPPALRTIESGEIVVCLSGIDVVSESHSSTEDVPENAAARVGPGPHADADFESVRSRLLGIAYRYLGRAADAEDVVQDVWLRWQRVDPARVRDPAAFLATVTAHAALNAATSAWARHEVSVEFRSPTHAPWSVDPAPGAERREALASALRLLMERLPPVERAVYILREAFAYPFREIADLLGLSEGNARQLAFRARGHLARRRHRPVDPAELDGLLEAFLDAARTGNMARLIGLFQGLRTPTSHGTPSGPVPSRGAAPRSRTPFPPDVRAARTAARTLVHHGEDPD